jgi:hypothetical protein
VSTNDGLRQASVRAATGTALDYNGDWQALFDQAGIAAGPFDGRMLAWCNAQLSAAYTSLPSAMDAFAVSQGAPNWSSLGAFTIGGGGGGSPSLDFSQSSNSMYVPALAA